MGIEEGTGKEIGGRRNANATMDVRSYDGWKSKWTTKVGELAKKFLEMRLKMYKRLSADEVYDHATSTQLKSENKKKMHDNLLHFAEFLYYLQHMPFDHSCRSC